MNKAQLGTFASKEVVFDLFTITENNKLIIFFHGCCGTVYEQNPTTYQLLSELLVSDGSASCAIFENSRRLRKTEIPPDMEFFEFASEAFGGKTFEQELQDARNTVEYLLEQYAKVNKNEPELYFIGFSLGGLIASILSSEYPVKGTMLFGSASRFEIMEGLPILGEQHRQDEVQELVKKKAASITSPVMIIRGTQDDLAAHQDSVELLTYFEKSGKKYFVEWLGVDHRFKLKDGEPDDTLIDDLKKTVQSFISLY